MCRHDHLHVLKLSTRQGHYSIRQLCFAHLLLFHGLTKTVWFSLDEVIEFVAWWKQAHFFLFVYTVEVQSLHVDLVIFRIHVNTLMLVCGLLVILLDCGKELDVDMFSPCYWFQLLHKHCYPFVPCAIPCPCHRGKSYPTWCGQYSLRLPHSKNCG